MSSLPSSEQPQGDGRGCRNTFYENGYRQNGQPSNWKTAHKTSIVFWALFHGSLCHRHVIVDVVKIGRFKKNEYRTVYAFFIRSGPEGEAQAPPPPLSPPGITVERPVGRPCPGILVLLLCIMVQRAHPPRPHTHTPTRLAHPPRPLPHTPTPPAHPHTPASAHVLQTCSLQCAQCHTRPVRSPAIACCAAPATRCDYRRPHRRKALHFQNRFQKSPIKTFQKVSKKWTTAFPVFLPQTPNRHRRSCASRDLEMVGFRRYQSTGMRCAGWATGRWKQGPTAPCLFRAALRCAVPWCGVAWRALALVRVVVCGAVRCGAASSRIVPCRSVSRRAVPKPVPMPEATRSARARAAASAKVRFSHRQGGIRMAVLQKTSLLLLSSTASPPPPLFYYVSAPPPPTPSSLPVIP